VGNGKKGSNYGIELSRLGFHLDKSSGFHVSYQRLDHALAYCKETYSIAQLQCVFWMHQWISIVFLDVMKGIDRNLCCVVVVQQFNIPDYLKGT